MHLLNDELRLACALFLNGIILASAWRFVARRGAGGRIQILLDTLLLWLIVQYATVGLLGIIGILTPGLMALLALTIAGGLWLAAGRGHGQAISIQTPPSVYAKADFWCAATVTLFVIGYVAAFAHQQRFLPPLATDALAYHLPTAVQWLQTGRIGLFEAWYWNPANTYSPLAAETFITWLLAPIGNDVLARFVQIPALAMIFLAMIQLCRTIGSGLGVAVLIAAGTILSRPFLSQALLVKDDLFMAAFFITAVVAFSQEYIGKPLAPWRVGAALGMLIATKYPAMVTLPLFLLVIDAPRRAGWRFRHGAIAVAVALLLAGPWFIRNLWLTGNPLYPIDITIAGINIFEGIFSVRRSDQLKTWHGIWTMLSQGYHALPPGLILLLVTAWLAVICAAGRRLWRDPMTRLCLFGPAVGLAVFIIASPHPEVRYFFPSFLPLFAAAALAITKIVRPYWAQVFISATFTALATATGLTSVYRDSVLGFSLAGASLAAAGIGWLLMLRRWGRPGIILSGTAAMLMLTMAVYAYWPGYIMQYRQATDLVWENTYGSRAAVWRFVRHKLPADATVAYANTYLIYPLQGFNYERRVVYAPTRTGVDSFLKLPKLGNRIEGYELVQIVTRTMNAEPDFQTWLTHLKRIKARYLVIIKEDRVTNVPELDFAGENPGRFIPLFDEPGGVVFEIIKHSADGSIEN